ncbi:MAG: hydroxymethylbilane synthase [Gemmatimonadetes bacterium]|nr:hydroxymethylbilane synthase [Gemmatimonadota bacterium]
MTASEDESRDRIVIGSRRSRLARAQATWVGDRLRRRWPELEVAYETFDTRGDRELDRPIPEIGGKGVFTAEIDAALAEGRIDVAVHSLKDLPVADRSGAVLTIPGRADPADVLVRSAARDEARSMSAETVTSDGSTALERLAAGARIGTSSSRRSAQVARLRPDLAVLPIRGNIETRLAKLATGELDALILAAAGLSRLALAPADVVRLGPRGWLPAPGQGALGVQSRRGDERTAVRLEAVEDPVASAAVAAERAVLEALEGSCQVPIGAYAETRADGRLRLRAGVFGGEAGRSIEAGAVGALADARALGLDLGAELRRRGAADVIAELKT